MFCFATNKWTLTVFFHCFVLMAGSRDVYTNSPCWQVCDVIYISASKQSLMFSLTMHILHTCVRDGVFITIFHIYYSDPKLVLEINVWCRTRNPPCLFID